MDFGERMGRLVRETEGFALVLEDSFELPLGTRKDQGQCDSLSVEVVLLASSTPAHPERLRPFVGQVRQRDNAASSSAKAGSTYWCFRALLSG